MTLSVAAEDTLAIIARGTYTAPSGATVDVRALVDAAVQGTTLYRPSDFAALASDVRASTEAPLRVEVTGETTAAAARRLVASEGEANVLALNFASAKNPGGGFLRGAKAQEEDLARCSALYTCQLTQRAYYDANRASGSMLYTDHMIHSPDVPFFKDERLAPLETPFVVSVLTAPAPNAGEARGRAESSRVRATLEDRAGKVLAVAADKGHRTLVLGAWGCGVFRNDPVEVAAIFDRWLRSDRFRGVFGRVVFAVYDRSKEASNRRAFEARFG